MLYVKDLNMNAEDMINKFEVALLLVRIVLDYRRILIKGY